MTPEQFARADREFQQAVRSPREAQTKLLLEILRDHGGTEYGRKHGFSEITDLATWQRRVPVTGYDDISDSVDRMLAGEPDVLVPGRPIFFARTSGTSGKPKYVAYPGTLEPEYFGYAGPMMAALERDYPGSAYDAIMITGKYIEDQAPSGIPIGSAGGFARNLSANLDDVSMRFAPEAIFDMTEFEARYYAMARYALAMPLQRLWALNPSNFLILFDTITKHGDKMVRDLRDGSLIGLPGIPQVPNPYGPALRPEPRMADRLEASLRANGRFTPEEIWPKLRVLHTWKGGLQGHYLRTLRERCPSCVVRPTNSAASEGLLMVALKDEWQGGVPALTSTVIEYLAGDDPHAPGAFTDVTDLEDGVGYRIAITNRRGMYRYLMDDVFYVEGRYECTPVLRYSHRYGITCSITGEKLTEAQVATAVEAALAATNLRVTDMQLAPEWGEPPHYALLLELLEPTPQDRQRAFLRAFEQALCEANIEYRDKRASQRLGAPTLIVLAQGSFQRMRVAMSANRKGSDAQVKIPRLKRDFFERDTATIDGTMSLE